MGASAAEVQEHARPTTTVLCYRGGVLRDDIPFDAVDTQIAKPEHLVWLDLERPDSSELDRLQHELSLHPLVLQDLRIPHQRPKVDEYEHLTLVVLFAAHITRRVRLHLSQVAIFVGPGYIVTLHRDPVPPLEALRARWRANPALVEPHPHEFLLYRICAALVEAYFPLVDAFDARIERVEDKLFTSFSPQLLREIQLVRRDLTELRRIIAPPRDVFTTLARHDEPNVGAAVAPYFTDLVDLILRLTDTIDTLRDRISTALDSYLTLQSNSLNETMKRLTGLTLILSLPMIISGIYGMNFDGMPELHWRFGYPMALGLIVGSAVLAWWYMRQKDWL